MRVSKRLSKSLESVREDDNITHGARINFNFNHRWVYYQRMEWSTNIVRACIVCHLSKLFKEGKVKICDFGHDEIVYVGDNCPMCTLQKENEMLEEENATLQDEVERLKEMGENL